MAGPSPALSVIVATGVAGGNRDACLAAANAHGLAEGDVEIIDHPVDGDLGRAWNAGAARAVGRTLLFSRDDIILLPGYAGEHLALVRQRPRDLAIGPTRLDVNADGLARQYGEDVGTESALAECCGRTLAMQREVFRESGGFATGLEWGTEAELAFRLSRWGVLLARLPRPVGTRHLPRTLGDVAKVLAGEGRGSVELYRRHPELLPHLKLGAYAAGGEGALALRRFLLAIGGPIVPLRQLSALLPAGGRRDAWHRFLTGYLYWRGVRQALGDSDLWHRLAHGPVILMYHAIGDRGERPGCYVVPIGRFRRQLRWLELAGYQILSIDELVRCRREHRLPPRRSVAITFDDGYRDNWTLAVPELRKRRFTATFFLVTGKIGGTNDWDQAGELAGRPLVSEPDVRQMLEAGMTVGAHTRTHPALPQLSAAAMAGEVEGAREDLTRDIGVVPETFAYPFGLVDAASSRAVERAGYAGACCSRSGVNDPAVPSFLLRRLEVRGTDSLLRFALGVRRGRARRRRQ